jgi:hypothetical protein
MLYAYLRARWDHVFLSTQADRTVGSTNKPEKRAKGAAENNEIKTGGYAQSR